MIRCNNCMQLFESENDLLEIVEVSKFYDGSWHTVDRYPYDRYNHNEPEEDEDTRWEIFKGCPDCCADEWLMDISGYIEEE